MYTFCASELSNYGTKGVRLVSLGAWAAWFLVGGLGFRILSLGFGLEPKPPSPFADLLSGALGLRMLSYILEARHSTIQVLGLRGKVCDPPHWSATP